jgi:hypothetical protein
VHITVGAPSKDFEPEQFVFSSNSRYLYVGLQEQNTMAVLDIENAVFIRLLPLGLKDWTGLKIDASDQDGGINMRSYSNLFVSRHKLYFCFRILLLYLKMYPYLLLALWCGPYDETFLLGHVST